ncbi:hypothetical protein G7Y89_g4611 [Cudoniella acicularis]|uniref:Uncharacterized protein n=1 Tax=Cudoniella acicularis TaxID=354080 RepID=A0A8H4W448_9HELO|nr:hypothetical protein G7Y89_g4611 [Cudoniella acicularis]
MDPASIIGVVNSLVSMRANVSKGLNDIQTKYNQSILTISAITSECSVIAAVLAQIESIARRDPERLTSRLDPHASQLGASFELVLKGCSIILLVLNDEIEKITKVNKVGFLSWKSKVKYIWDGEGLKDLLFTIRGQQGALRLLVTAINTESVSDIHCMLQDNNTAPQKVVERTQTLRKKRAKSTVGGQEGAECTIEGQDTEFKFDNHVVSSKAYRRAFRSFGRRSGSTLQGTELNPAELNDSEYLLLQGLPGPWIFTLVDESPNSKNATNIETSTQQDLLLPILGAPGQPITECLAEIVPAGPALKQVNIQFNTSLRNAATTGATETVLTLLAQRANINSVGEKGRTPLMLAAWNGNVKTVRALLRAGADIFLKSS